MERAMGLDVMKRWSRYIFSLLLKTAACDLKGLCSWVLAIYESHTEFRCKASSFVLINLILVELYPVSKMLSHEKVFRLLVGFAAISATIKTFMCPFCGCTWKSFGSLVLQYNSVNCVVPLVKVDIFNWCYCAWSWASYSLMAVWSLGLIEAAITVCCLHKQEVELHSALVGDWYWGKVHVAWEAYKSVIVFVNRRLELQCLWRHSFL